MSILTDLIDGVAQTADAGARTVESKMRALLLGVSLLLVLLFLLILFALEPMSATLITVLAIGILGYLVATDRLG